MAGHPNNHSIHGTKGDIPACEHECEPVDFRQRVAALPRLLDDSDLAQFRRLGISVRPIRRARRRYFLELLRDVERESERIAGLMALAPTPEFAEIMEFRRATRRHVKQLRLFAFLHGLGFQVEKLSRTHSASVTAMLLSATGS